jgi:hypothetical protein
MPIINDLELPIEPLKIDGPAVRGLYQRKEENNNERAEIAKFLQSYEPIKEKVLSGLRKLASISFA